MSNKPTAQDLTFLRQAISLSEQAVANGERPFGAAIVNDRGELLSEAYAVTVADKDPTAHAEVTAIRRAARHFPLDELTRVTIYSSCEPCAMCAGAIYWAKIPRLVFGVSERRIRDLEAQFPDQRDVDVSVAAQRLNCREVLLSGGHAAEVTGPTLEDEAFAVHKELWSKARHSG